MQYQKNFEGYGLDMNSYQGSEKQYKPGDETTEFGSYLTQLWTGDHSADRIAKINIDLSTREYDPNYVIQMRVGTTNRGGVAVKTDHIAEGKQLKNLANRGISQQDHHLHLETDSIGNLKKVSYKDMYERDIEISR